MTLQIDSCFDYLKCLIGKKVIIDCNENWQIKGVLNAYDEHVNLLLSDVTEKENSQIQNHEVLFIRGDQVITVQSNQQEEKQPQLNIKAFPGMFDRTLKYPGGFPDQIDKKTALKILNLNPLATQKQITQRHRKLLMLNHPDRGGSTFIALKINEAKDSLLKDDEDFEFEK